MRLFRFSVSFGLSGVSHLATKNLNSDYLLLALPPGLPLALPALDPVVVLGARSSVPRRMRVVNLYGNAGRVTGGG